MKGSCRRNPGATKVDGLFLFAGAIARLELERLKAVQFGRRDSTGWDRLRAAVPLKRRPDRPGTISDDTIY